MSKRYEVVDGVIQYEPLAGEMVSHTATRMVQLMKDYGMAVEAKFNDVKLAAAPGVEAASIVQQYHNELERLSNTPEAKARRAESEKRTKADCKLKAATISAAAQRLPSLNFQDLGAVIAWLESIQDATDTVGVTFPRGLIVSTFEASGFSANAYCGDAYKADNRDIAARWLIGQALDGLAGRVGAIHPMFSELAKQWRAKFSAVTA